MLTQCKYAFRHNLNLRLGILIPLLVMNAVFALLSLSGVWGHGGKIVAVSLSGCGLAALMTIYVICDFGAISSLFSAPRGYVYMLAPVSSWKIAAGRVIAITVYDLAGFVLGTAGVVVQSFLLANVSRDISGAVLDSSWGLMVIMLLNYLQFILAIFLAAALAKSVFYRLPLRTLLGLLGAGAGVYLLSFLDLIHLPVNGFVRYGTFFQIEVVMGLHPGMLLYVLVALLKILLLFGAVARLMERKINL